MSSSISLDQGLEYGKCESAYAIDLTYIKNYMRLFFLMLVMVQANSSWLER